MTRTTKAILIDTVLVGTLLALAFLLPMGCATFKAASADIPATVGVGLNVSACVTAAFKDNPSNVLDRENAIYTCVASALSQLSEPQKRELLALPKS